MTDLLFQFFNRWVIQVVIVIMGNKNSINMRHRINETQQIFTVTSAAYERNRGSDWTKHWVYQYLFIIDTE